MQKVESEPQEPEPQVEPIKKQRKPRGRPKGTTKKEGTTRTRTKKITDLGRAETLQQWIEEGEMING